MLEFLKECNQTIVYERARDCERSIKNFNPLTDMAVFIETLFKRIYMEYHTDEDESSVGNMRFIDLLKNTAFTDILKQRYNIADADIRLANKELRPYSNDLKHKPISVRKASDNQVKTCFHCVYNIAAAYYTVKARKPMPVWSDEEYAALLANTIDDNERKAREERVKAEIESLTKDNDAAKAALEEARQQLDDVNKQLEELRESSLSDETLAEFRSKSQQLKDEIAQKDREILLLSQKEAEAKEELAIIKQSISDLRESAAADTEEAKIKIAELESREAEANNRAAILQSQNAELAEQIAHLSEEQIILKEQLNAQSDNSENKAVIEEYQQKLAEAERIADDALAKLSETQKKLEAAQQSLYQPNNQITQLSQDILDQELQELNAKCPRCGSSLTPRMRRKDSKLFWGCSAWKKDNTGCNFARDITEEEYPLAVHMYQRKTGTAKKITLPPEVIERSTAGTVTYQDYPGFNRYDSAEEYFFQSLAIPTDLFSDRDKLGLPPAKKHSSNMSPKCFLSSAHMNTS